MAREKCPTSLSESTAISLSKVFSSASTERRVSYDRSFSLFNKDRTRGRVPSKEPREKRKIHQAEILLQEIRETPANDRLLGGSIEKL